jgi:pyridoxal phosphate enzyme (YggS family)
MAGTSVGMRLTHLKHEIAAACRQAGRDPSHARLLAVSKLQPADKIREAYAFGQRDFAENYLQEAVAKQRELRDLADIRWHFIGRIQSNKAKALAENFYAVHSVDRLALLEKLRGNQPLKVFLQLNIAEETSKAGAQVNELEALLQAALCCSHLQVAGLMLMPPLQSTLEQAENYFRIAQNLTAQWQLKELSMGTSHDYKLAIAYGATWVRIGTDLFGSRPLQMKETQE